MALVKNEIARFAVIDVTGGNVGNVYFEVQEVVEEDGVQIGAANKRNIAASVEDVAAFVGEATATIAAANATLNAQNTALQEANAALTQQRDAARAACAAVAEADASWDDSVRAKLAAVLGDA